VLIIGIREIEAKIQEKKKQIASFKDRFKIDIDKFTKQDEILLELLREQEETNKLLVLNNRILLTLLKTQFGEDISLIESLEGYGEEGYQTINIQTSGKDVNYRKEGSGFIELIRLVSSSLDVNNKDYSIEVVCDDNVLYKGSWDTLEGRSATEKGMVCFEDEIDEQYILNFLGNYYSEYFEVKVYDSKATFSLFQIKFHSKV
jgi:hypothetical protein